ncbi:MAG: hypothetical protein PHV02_04860 [Rhodocyclaceae bacterium]|nr:hypothetical protein [Rhodocyclaceae bacterium]
MPIYALVLALFCLASPLASAQGSPLAPMARPFPAGATKGVLTPPVGLQVQIDGKIYNAASGLQIRNTRNLIVMPNTLLGEMPIRYQFDQTGKVWRIWILTPAEQAVIDPKK